MKAWKASPILALILLAGCSSNATDTPKTADSTTPATTTPATPTTGKKLKVALLTPGPVSDAGWNALAFEGLKSIEKDMGAEVNNEEAGGTQIRDSLRAYAQKGYDLVFGHGYEYNEPAIAVAKDFPKTVFITSSGGKTAPNVGAFRFYLEEAFYLAGYMAGGMSKTGAVAMIGGPDIPSIHSTFDGFRDGALAANPKIKVIEKFTNKDSDIASAHQATLAAIDQGADFVIHQANGGAQGVFDACKEKGVYAFGANLDQNDNPSGVVIGSPIIKATGAFEAVAKDVQAGTFKGGIILVGEDKDAIDFVINPKLKDKVPPALLAKLDSLKADIKSGKLVVRKRDF